MSDILFVVLYHLIRYRRKVVDENLRRCFPHWQATQVAQCRKAFYKNLCDIIVETIKAISIPATQLNKHVEVIRSPDFEKLKTLHANQPVLALTAHYANWEWLLLAHKLQTGCEIDAVYKPLHNPFFDRLMLTIRSRFGVRPVPATQLFRDMVARRQVVRAVAMVADQTPGPENTVLTHFLGVPTYFYNGSGKLAEKFQLPVYFSWIERRRRGQYVVHLKLLKNPPHHDYTEIVLLYKKALEEIILQQPESWLWSHRRWKYPPHAHIID